MIEDLIVLVPTIVQLVCLKLKDKIVAMIVPAIVQLQMGKNIMSEVPYISHKENHPQYHQGNSSSAHEHYDIVHLLEARGSAQDEPHRTSSHVDEFKNRHYKQETQVPVKAV